MTALTGMRLSGFVRTGRAFAPLIAALVVLGAAYGGGHAQAGEAYGFSAAVLFPVLAWQTKLLLDNEPDVQRRLALVAVGSRTREIAAGLLAAALAALAVVVLSLAVPWLLGGVTGPQRPGDPGLGEGVAAGVWANLLLLPAGLALGALASRAATGSTARGLAVLATGVVFGYVLGVRGSVVPWFAPPVLPAGRSTVAGLEPAAMIGHTVHSLLWTAAVLALYAWLRRRRA